MRYFEAPALWGRSVRYLRSSSFLEVIRAYLRSSIPLGAICALFTQLQRSGDDLCVIYAAPAVWGG